MDEFWTESAKLLAAVAAGALIGLERELADKPAGFRTNILICLGAALFTLISVRMSTGPAVDRTRIAAQIVTGVGFLGAGAIIQFRGAIVGLTTAATIWAVASVGMAFGAGEFALGLAGTLLTSGVLFGLGLVEGRINEWRVVAVFEMELEPSVDVHALVQRLMSTTRARLRSYSVSKARDGLHGRVTVVGSAEHLQKLEEFLWKEPTVHALRRI